MIMLIFLYLEMHQQHYLKAKPKLIIAVRVGFVGAAESKENLEELNVPYIRVKGRKGGSTVAAAIVNALMYNVVER